MIGDGERRDDPRVRIEGAHARVAEGSRTKADLEDESLWRQVRLVDLSAGGLSFQVDRDESNEHWVVGQRLSVHIVPTIGITEPMSEIVVIARREEIFDDGFLMRCQALDWLPES